MILAAAESGARTLAVLGPAGTGKTLLLRELLRELKAAGRQTKLLPRGDLPVQLMPPGAVLLVDEASRLSPLALAQLSMQKRGFVILADLPVFGRRLQTLPMPPAVIMMTPLDPWEVPEFVAAWNASNERGALVRPDAMDRLAFHSGGTPRLITQLLNAALALARPGPTREIDGPAIDQVAALRLGELEEKAPVDDRAPHADGSLVDNPERSAVATPSPPAEAVPPSIAPLPVEANSGVQQAALIAVTAIAAGVALALIVAPRLLHRDRSPAPTTTSESASTSASAPARVAADMAPASRADTSAPRLAASAPPPAVLPIPAPTIAAAPPAEPSVPKPAAAEADAPVLAPAPAVAQAAPAQLPAAAPAQMPAAEPAQMPHPVAAATPDLGHTEQLVPTAQVAVPQIPAPSDSAPTGTASVEPSSPPLPSGGPGLIFLAQRGDTLASLYSKVYQGLAPPPFSAVLAANPRPVHPGDMIVFPAPPGGWNRR